MAVVAAWAATAISAAANVVGAPLVMAGLSKGTALAVGSFVVKAALNVALSAAATALMAPKVNAEGSPTEWVADPDAPIPFAAGRVGIAGRIVHRDEFGPDNMYQTVITVLSGAGPINSVVSYAGDDQPVTFHATSGAALTSQWVGEMWMQYRLGAQPETAHTSPAGLKSGATLPSWNSNSKMSGKASAFLTMGENSKRSAYPTGEPKPVWVIEGLKGWDPRLDSTYPGGSGSCRLNDPATWVYITNPILWALKWSLGLWEGPTGKGAPQVDYQVGGIGAKVEGIDVAAFVEAANVADANGWVTAAWPTTDDDKAQVLDAFLQAGGAVYAQKAGLMSCIHRAAPRTSIVTISAADTAGPLEIDTAAPRIGRINTIRPKFWDESNHWQMTAIDEVTSATWQTEDGGKRTRGVDFPYVPDATQAAQLACLQIANTREGIVGKIPLKPYLQKITPGDAFTITEEGFVLDGLKCLCLNTEYDAATGVHTVSFVSETDGKYAYAFGLTATPPVAPSLTPVDPTVVSPPDVSEWSLAGGTITGDDGAEVPALVLTGSCENAQATTVIFEYRRDGATDWIPAGTESPEVETKQITGLAPGDWECAVSYRVGRNTSTRLVLGPVVLTAIVVPLTPGVLDDGGVVRVPPGYTGGGLVVDTDTADHMATGLKVLSTKDTADTPEIEPNAVTDPTISAPSGAVSILSTTKVLIDSVTITVNAGERVKVEPSFDLDMISTAGTRGDSVAIAVVRIQRGLDSDPGVVYLTPNRRMHHVHADSAQYAMITLSANDFPPAGTHTYYVYGACVYAVSPPSTTVLVRERSTEVTRFKR